MLAAEDLDYSSSMKTLENSRFKKFLHVDTSGVSIWKSKVSWRVAFAVFLTIALVQACALIMEMNSYRTEKLTELESSAKAAVFSLIDMDLGGDQYSLPFTRKRVNFLLDSTHVKGLAVYSIDRNLIDTFGEPVFLDLLSGSTEMNRKHFVPDESRYEFEVNTSEAGVMYYMVIRLDTSSIPERLQLFVWHNIMVMFLLSALVTSVLMFTLSKELIEPLLFLRENTIRASKDPENPELPLSTYDPDGEIGEVINQVRNLIKQNAENISRIKSTAEDQIHRLAYYDPLTGLPNRTLFLQKLSEQSREAGEGKNTKFAVVTMDLDHFKDVNDTMGHSVGDAILRAVGKRLRSTLPPNCVVARSGEDEFSIMMPLDSEYTTSRAVGLKVLETIRSVPFKVFNENFQVRTSVGSAVYPDDAVDPDQVLKNADIALNRAKEEGRDSLREYSEDFDNAVQQRFMMLRDLRDALEKEQLILFFQPQIDLKTGEIFGAEALLRWWKPCDNKEGGTFIPPGTFIPVAEQSGLILPLGEWVIKQACLAAARLEKELGKNIRIAINVSGAQFHQSDLSQIIRNLISEAGIEPSKIELEVTESAFMEDVGKTIKVLNDLHNLGAEIAIDDFGTGYSSLSYLRQFPIDRLKIDQSFIRNALNNPDDASITKTIIGLGRTLGLRVIAEGVETSEHERFLVNEGCDEVQGYRYSKPVSFDDFVKFVKEYNGNLSDFDQ